MVSKQEEEKKRLHQYRQHQCVVLFRIPNEFSFFHGFLGYNGEKNSQILSFQKVKHQGKSRNFICEKICVCVEIQYSRRYVFSLFE